MKMEVNKEPITKALALLSSLKHEIITMQSDTVSMETLITNLFKYFAVLREEIVVPDAHSSGLQGQLEEIFQSLTACKDLVLRHKSSGEVILRQADLVGESCLQAKSASQSDTAEQTFSDVKIGLESSITSITLQEFKNENARSDSDDNDIGSLGDFPCLDVTVKNEVDNDDPLGKQSLEGFDNQSLSVVNEIRDIPSQEVTNSENTTASLLKLENCDDICKSELDLNSHLQSNSQDNNKDTLRCNECRKDFNSKQALAYHLRHSKAHTKKFTKTGKTRASSRKPISETISAKSKLKPNRSKQKPALTGCAECGKCFKTVKALDVHMAQKHKGGRFTCGQCNKAYRSKAALEYHLTASNAHKNQVKIEENQIEVADNDSKWAEESVSNDDTKEKSVSISPTEEKLSIIPKEEKLSISPTEEKLETDIIEKKYNCNVCEKRYQSRHGLWCHRKKTKHLKSNDKQLKESPLENGDLQSNVNDGSSKGSKYCCEICGSDFANTHSLSRHQWRRHQIERSQRSKPYVCDQCGKKCSNKWCLKLHVDNIHKTPVLETCKVCGVQLANMKQHMALHAGLKLHVDNIHKTPVLETCKVCGVQLANMKQHMALHAEKKYKCPECGKEFRWKGCLQRHLEYHSGIKPHMCEICGKAYVEKGALEYHMAGHLNSRTEFTCDVCGKGFTHKSLLSTHQKVHAEAKFSCEVCGRSFKRARSLVTHMVTHTGEKTHKCKICGEMFLHDSVLGRHVRKHKGLKPYVCSHCGKAFLDSWGRKQHMDRCLYGDRRRKEYRDSKTGSEAALSAVTVTPIACEPVLTASPPVVSVNIEHFMQQE